MALNFKTIVLFLAISFSYFSVSAQQNQANKNPSSLPVDSVSIKKLYEQALQDLSNQDFESAEGSLVEVLNADDKNTDARLALIRIYFFQKRLEEAEVLAKESTLINPSNDVFWKILTDLYKESKNYNALIPVFDQLIILEPKELKHHLDKGFTYSLLKKYKSALKVYNQAEQEFGADESIYSGRSAVYLKQNKQKVAIKELEAYRNKNASKLNPYLMLAHLYLDLKKPKLALAELNTAEVQFPSMYDLFLTKADAYQQLKNDDEMLSQLKKAFSFPALEIERKIKIIFSIYQEFKSDKALDMADALSQVLIKTHPSDPKAYAVFGDILVQQGETDEAIAVFKKALAINPKMDIVWESLLQAEIAAGKHDLAHIDGDRSLIYAPQNSVLLLYTGYSHLFAKDYEKSRPYIERALDNADTKNESLMLQIYSALGDLYNALKMYPVSNVAYEEALSIDSNNTYILNNYAYYLSLRKDNLEKAAEFSKRSNELNPENASFQDTYAWILFQQENYSEALVWIDKAIKNSLEPSATLLEHQGDILSQLGKEKEALIWEKIFPRCKVMIIR